MSERLLSVVDNGWAFAALVVVSVYLLARKFGSQLLGIVTSNHDTLNGEVLDRLKNLDERLARLEARDADEQPPAGPAEG